VLWTNAAGQAATWLMNDQNVQQAAISGTIGIDWRVGGIGDINMDGRADIVWVNTTNNAVVIWYMSGTQVADSTVVSSGGQIGLDWALSGVGDVTGDQIAHIICAAEWSERGVGLEGLRGRDERRRGPRRLPDQCA